MTRNDESIELAKNRAWPMLKRLEADLAMGRIDEAGWYKRVAAVITPAYLAMENPRGQSGSDGDEADWAYKRGQLADAFDHDGTFLDVGCASGYSMETVQAWTARRGLTVEPYGLDIAPELADLTRRRLPQWRDRIYVGNAITWTPPRRFDFVRTGLEYVPARRQRDLVERLLEAVVAPGGRLIIGVFSEEIDATRSDPSEAERVAAWGFAIAGESERPHLTNPRLVYRAFWIDRPQ